MRFRQAIGPALLLALHVGTAPAADQTAGVVRDAFGIPHISAATDAALFDGFGYAVAEDRLWQLEFLKRDVRGTLAELDADYLPADINRRRLGYTEAELQASFTRLDPATRGIITAYVGGINRRIGEVLNRPDSLPYEFKRLGIAPSPWTVTDQLAAASALYRRFGTIGGSELSNLAVLEKLTDRYGQAVAWAMFEDLFWAADPQAHVNIGRPGSGAAAAPGAGPRTLGNPDAALRYLRQHRSAIAPAREHALALQASAELSLPLLYQRASFFFVVSGALSDSGYPLFSGNPQPGVQAFPALPYEVHLSGGSGFEVVGMSVPGQPVVILGRNRHLAWDTNVGSGDNVDIFVESLNPDNREQYRYRGVYRDMEKRTESFRVKGRAPVTMSFYRTVHGPVVAPTSFDPQDPAVAEVYTWHSAHWLLDTRITEGQLAHCRARDLEELDAAMSRIYASFHFIAADDAGDIGYWAAGRVPVRPAGSDFRLPLRGTGEDEWTGEFLELPAAINPAAGVITGWNTKATPGRSNPDSRYYGPFHRSLFVDKALADELEDRGRLDLAAVRRILLTMGRVGEAFGHSNAGIMLAELLPYLRRAVLELPPSDRDLEVFDAVLKRLSNWDGYAIDDVLRSDRLRPEQIIFDAWLTEFISRTFADEFAGIWDFSSFSAHNFNFLLHALGGSQASVPVSRNYFDDIRTPARVESAEGIIVDSMRAVIERLSSRYASADPSLWTEPRPAIQIRHLGPPEIAIPRSFPSGNSGVYSYLTELRPAAAKIASESRFQFGASGFIGADADGGARFDHPHLFDMLDAYIEFRYQPMFE